MNLWTATAAPAPSTPPPPASRRADVAIVGAGFTGLTAALHLAEQGIDTVVLDAAPLGGGASGRTGGQVIAGLKHDPDELEAMFGGERGARVVELVGNAADELFALVDRYKIDCVPVRAGWVQLAHSAEMLATVHRRAEQWQRRGAPVVLLDRRGTAELVGTDVYHGGWLDRRGGPVQPLSLTRGLARAALAAGAAVHADTRVTRLERPSARWRVRTATGATIDAERVVLATNGYTDDLWPRLRRTVIAANSFQIATRPLPDELRRSVLPGGPVASDTRRLLRYFRLDPAGRLVMGGRGRFREPRGAADFRHVERSIAQLFPRLAGVEIEFRWAGRVALTRDHLPHLHEPAPGVLACLGYNGRGVALATSMGRYIAEYIADPARHPLPLPVTPIEPIPLHGMHRAYVSALAAWYRLSDAVTAR
jgi:glycine/D-amino acid oxidase-like deaminating enzyme